VIAAARRGYLRSPPQLGFHAHDLPCQRCHALSLAWPDRPRLNTPRHDRTTRVCRRGSNATAPGPARWLGSGLVVASLAQTRALPFRLLNLASAVVLLAFNLAIGLWSMVVLNVVILGVNGWQLHALTRRPVRRVRARAQMPPRALAPTARTGEGGAP
jgi:hypothetical protein